MKNWGWKMKISIIIPAYNCEKYIGRCLKSILQQNYKNYEVIVVNDGSTDKTGIISEQFAKKDKRFMIINQENGGVSKARNNGIMQSAGEYIMFVDGDDLLARNSLRNLVDGARGGVQDIVKGGIIKKGRFIRLLLRYPQDIIGNRKMIDSGIANAVFETDYLCPVWGCLYKRSLIQDIHFNEKIKLGEDFEFFINSILRSQTFTILNKKTYIYRINNNSITRKFDFKKNKKMLVDAITVNRRVEKALYENGKRVERFKKSSRNIMALLEMMTVSFSKNDFMERMDELMSDEIIASEIKSIKDELGLDIIRNASRKYRIRRTALVIEKKLKKIL